MSKRTRNYVASRLAQIKQENIAEDIIMSQAQGSPNQAGIQNSRPLTQDEMARNMASQQNLQNQADGSQSQAAAHNVNLPFTSIEPADEPVYPIIQSYTFIRISDGQTGGFTHAIITTQGDKVLNTDIVDHIYPKNIAEDDFRAVIARQIFHLAPETTYQIEFKDGRYKWKAL